MLVRASRNVQSSGAPESVQEAECAPHASAPPPSKLPADLDFPLELAVDLIWQTDADLEFTRFSGPLCERLADPPARLLATNAGDGLLKANGELVRQSDLAEIAARRAFRGVICTLSTNAGPTYLRLSGVPTVDAFGEFYGFRGVGIDVTVEVERWQHDRDQLQNYVEGLESISEGLALFDANDLLVLCNRKYKEIHAKLGDVICRGAHFEEIARAAAYRGIVPEASGREMEWVGERIESHHNPGPPIEQMLDTGEWVLVSERKTKSGGVVSVRTDITDLKLREIALIESEARADLANRAKSEFLANMSHELRTPLNAVIGFSESLESGIFGELTEQQKTYLNDIRSAGTHLLGLINDILDISKVEAGRIELREDWVDLHRLIRDCLRLMKARAKESGLNLRRALAGPPPIIWADEQRLKQIFLNLMSNAMKFTPAGGDVAVEVAVHPKKAVVIRVVDTGIGMRPDDISRCLEPFFQVESALVRKHHGTGLGLPLTKRLVECHDGTLEIESAVGEGTSAIVRLPVNRLRWRSG